MRARGRYGGLRGQDSVKLSSASLSALLAAALLAGCGGIDSSDSVLSTGEVSGRVTNATAPKSAYAYVFGHPEIRSQVRDDGSFTLERVPLGNGAARVVLYDGGDLGRGRAELVDVEVKPAARTHVEKDAQQMPLAGSIAAVVICAGNQRGDGARYKVDGTEFDDDDRHQGASVTLYPIPPGDYTLHATLPGMKGNPKSVTVAAGAVVLGEVDMNADEADANRGCISTQCSGSLYCDDGDGSCYECTSKSGCAGGLECKSHVCR
jgi:hypothetical protein